MIRRQLACTLLVATMLAACFGDNEGSNGVSAEVTSAPASVDAEGGTADVTLRVLGRPGEAYSIALASRLGMFTPGATTVVADAAGLAEVTSRFTSGAEAGTEETTVTVEGERGASATTTVSFPITALRREGMVTQLPTTEAADLTSLEGQAITLAAAGTLRRVGIVAPASVDVVIGIYAETAGVPTTRVAQTTATLRAGINELPVTPVALPAGSYWFMANYRTATPLYIGTAMRQTRYVTTAFTTTVPATYPTHMTYNDFVRNYYLVVGQ